MNFIVKSINKSSKGILHFQGQDFDCALGKNGTIAALDKREGDNCTPIGVWPIRKVYYRADKIEKPNVKFETISIEPNFGWCDAPNDKNYNKFVFHPYEQSAEKLWREDGLYDLCVVLGHNDNPVIAGMGSAIFLHVARDNYAHTEGCVALKYQDLKYILENCSAATSLEIVS